MQKDIALEAQKIASEKKELQDLAQQEETLKKRLDALKDVMDSVRQQISTESDNIKHHEERLKGLGDLAQTLESDIKGKRMKRKKERKRLMKFKEFEGAGFGSTDYRNVTGNATTSGYLFDNQPIGKSGGNIAMNIPRSNYYEPTTFILGQETEIIEDPYFNYKRIRRKDRKRKKDKELVRKSKKFNDLYKKM